MVRIAPVRFPFNPKALWFDACDLDIAVNDPVVVLTARGLEFGYLDDAIFEATEEQISALSSPLKPVRRVALDEDVERAMELERKGREAMPLFRELAAAKAPEMNPVAVEFLFDSDKAVFYFESDDRIDFRDLVRDLAMQFHVRVDMKQIGVRDEARMVGGIGHCGQELCCARLGGDFNPVSIRMAKEQGLSLNPQKISGLCGRLMCCLRYEYDAYKDFHGRAPKKNAKVQTPAGEGKVVDMDVPRETISILVEDEKPVSVPLSEMETVGDSARPNFVGEEAWERAHATTEVDPLTSSMLLVSQLTEKDKLAEEPAAKHGGGDGKRSQKQGAQARSARGRKRAQTNAPQQDEQHDTRKPRRRRSTKVVAESPEAASEQESSKQQARNQAAAQRPKAQHREDADVSGGQGSQRTRRRRSSDAQRRQSGSDASSQKDAAHSASPGRKSSALRARESGSNNAGANRNQRPQKRHDGSAHARKEGASAQAASDGARRVRRRTHKSASSGSEGAQGASQE